MSTDSALPTLCEEQEAACDQILKTDKRATILTGCAGSGKSVLMKTLIERYPDKFALTSTTARSALHIGGVTVDRLFSINRETWKFRNFSRMSDNLHGCGEFIVVDEASMVGEKMAKLLREALDHGSRKVILCGDWAQASPVKDAWPLGEELFREADLIFLRECHRQSDTGFLKALNEVRCGQVTPETAEFFSSRVIEEDTHERDVVKMYATNSSVDRYNNLRLEKHAKERKRSIFTLEGMLEDVRSSYAKKHYPVTEAQRDRTLGMSPLAHKERFAAGCRVIVTYNVPNDGSAPAAGPWLAVNGDTGTLQGVDNEACPRVMHVQLDRTNKTVKISKIKMDVFGYSRSSPDFHVSGFPLRLGYAITIHKSQGMTLEKVEVDMESILRHPEETRHGLAYVAFSRARTPEGLALLNWRADAVYSDPMMAGLVGASNAHAK